MPALLDLRPDELLSAVGFEMTEDMAPGCRVSIYEMPRPGRIYALGSDFALGQLDNDLDTGCVLDATELPAVQVAEFAGTLGEISDKMLYGMGMFYGGAFIVGERQFGLPSLRRLLRDFKYGWLYYERDETKKSRPLMDKLGYHKKGNWTTDPMLREYRRAVRAGDIVIRSEELYDQMRRLQYKAKKSIEPEDALDTDLQVKLSGGGSPDLVMAAAYAWLGCRELVNFPRIVPKYAPGTYGDILGLDQIEVDRPAYAPGTPQQARATRVANVSTRRPRK